MEQTKGLTFVLTGDGKGKTTSSIGMIIRALGHDQKVCLIQFLKSPDSGYGEITTLNKLGIENYQIGAGCTWNSDNDQSYISGIKAWKLAVEKVNSNNYDLIVLDEVNHLLNFPTTIGKEVIQVSDLIHLIKTKPPKLNLVLTGRNAHSKIIEIADMVSEVQCNKHHYNKGILATQGIEY